MKSFHLSSSKTSSLLVGLILSSIVLPGCGGGGGGSTKATPMGKLKFTVTWPSQAARVIPTNAQSLLVTVVDASGTTQTATIVRPATTTSFSELAVGSASVTATAFANATATGTPLATATVSSTISNGTVSNVDVTLASTIDHIAVTPNPYTIGAGTSSTINVVAYDAANNVVLMDPSTLSFATTNSALASVSSTGLVTAGTVDGSATITISQSDSGKTLSLPLSVVPQVTLGSNAANVTLRGTASFTATVVGPSNTGVTWSVLEGAGGSITAGGLYTAPTTHGTYHVVATSVADPTRSATATVTVTSGGVNVAVH